MADYGLYKNAEGYADPTAAEAIKDLPKPGEIYKYKGREVLIVKNQGGYCNILTLSATPGKSKEWVNVAGRYTTPGKLNYAFNDRLGAMVERITDDELLDIILEIDYALFGATKAINKKNFKTEETAVRMDFEAENKALKKKNSLLRAMYDELLDRFIEKFGCL